MPRRISGVHCMDVPVGNSGGDALADFPGDLIRLHLSRGFEIPRPSRYLERTARGPQPDHGQAHDTPDHGGGRHSDGIASADYLLIYRKRGENPVPVTHPNGFTTYHGASQPPAESAPVHQPSGQSSRFRI